MESCDTPSNLQRIWVENRMNLAWLRKREQVAYFAYGAFLTLGANLMLIGAQVKMPPYAVLGLSLLLAGAPLIIGILTERALYMNLFMVSVVLVVSGLYYFVRPQVPDAEPDKASAYAYAWFAQVESDPDEAFTHFRGPKHDQEFILKQIAKVGAASLKVDGVQQYAPHNVEGRGDCNAYDVNFSHPGGSAIVGLNQCYDGGPEFEVWRANITIDAETVGNNKN